MQLRDSVKLVWSSRWLSLFHDQAMTRMLELHADRVLRHGAEPERAFELARKDSGADLSPAASSSPFLLADDLVFADHTLPIWIRLVDDRDPDSWLSLSLEDAEDVELLASALSHCAGTQPDGLASGAHDLYAELADRKWLEQRSTPVRAAPHSIRRFQHACLEFRGAGGSILVDPHFQSAYGSGDGSVLRPASVGKPDAILISHGHGDHFDLTTLMQFPRDTPIVVPRVPRGSMLSGDDAALLRAMGFSRVYDPPWFSSLAFGDQRVEVLPFYGEQPWRWDEPADPALRNWGNTYLIRAPRHTTWVVIDAGFEHAQSCVELAAQIREEYGPPDLMLSTLRTFHWFPRAITGDGRYWWALSKQQMRAARQWNTTREPLTLGPLGVARALAAGGIGHYAPYAHLWAPPGTPVGTGEAHTPFERDMAAEVKRHVASAGAAARVLDWNVGDSLAFRARGDFDLIPYTE